MTIGLRRTAGHLAGKIGASAATELESGRGLYFYIAADSVLRVFCGAEATLEISTPRRGAEVRIEMPYVADDAVGRPSVVGRHHGGACDTGYPKKYGLL